MNVVEDLGFTKEELQDRVVQKCAEWVMSGTGFDEDDGTSFETTSAFADGLKKLVSERVAATIQAIAEAHVLPNVSSYVENICLQQTTAWGEKVGPPLSFVEYLVQRAELYLTEKVDHDGNNKSEARSSYGWSGSQTRITHLVHKHLQYSIATAMDAAMKNANSFIVSGLAETVKLKLAEFNAALSVTLKAK